MKVKLPILLLIAFLSYGEMKAQDTLLRKLNHNNSSPHFWIVGVTAENFPQLMSNSRAKDSVNYGKQILLWIENNKQQFKTIDATPQNYSNISYIDFKKFTSAQKLVFKELSSQYQPVLTFQKDRIRRLEQEQLGIKIKSGEANKTQVYLLSEAELVIWKKRLEI